MAIGGLLFATLLTVRRRERDAGTPGVSEKSLSEGSDVTTDANAGIGSSSEAAAGALSGAVLSYRYDPSMEHETSDTVDSLEETPEWEPHAAATDVVPVETVDDTVEDAPPEDVWADPTPTAMSDAVSVDEEAIEEPEQDSASFSNLMEDEPFAATASSPSTGSEIEDDPFATTGHDTTALPVEEPAAETPPAAASDIPDEEPFERAGRWWFKRGAELLVYNEQSGEWVPSPTPLPGLEQPEPARFGPDSSPTQTIADLTGAEPGIGEATGDTDTETAEQELVEPTGQQGFWRCPACGAVNGSTSATCRMCFAARPAS